MSECNANHIIPSSCYLLFRAEVYLADIVSLLTISHRTILKLIFTFSLFLIYIYVFTYAYFR